jgi:hypothetical protein
MPALNTTIVFINPASYTHEHKVNYNTDVPIGAPGTPLMFRGIPPETISFDVYFDATGAIEAPATMPGNKLPIGGQITQFKKVCFTYNGNIHEPNYLILNWGSLVFKCKLSSLRVEYTLFQKNGIPLRAKASCAFIKAIDANTIGKEANNKSPDLTHLFIIKQGDTLPNICNTMYGDPSYYLEVAAYNQIVNFRNLEPGTKLYLPPLK